MPTVTLHNSLQVAYADEGQGIPVLLLHGYCGSRRYWDEVLPLLTAAGDAGAAGDAAVPAIRVIAPDCRGHGETQATEGAYSMEQLAEDAAQLLEAIGVPQAIVLGHSMGGYTALAFAERYADKLLGIGLLHSTTLPDDEAGKAGRAKVAQRVAAEGIKGHIDDLIPKLFAPAHRTSMPDKLAKARDIGCGTSPLGAIGGALGMKERPDRKAALERLNVPILLLAGEADGVIAPEKRFTVDGPNVERVELPGIGHMGMMETPEAFAAAINAFVRKAASQSAFASTSAESADAAAPASGTAASAPADSATDGGEADV